MHLGYFDLMKDIDLGTARRAFLRSAATLGALAAMPVMAAPTVRGFKGEGRLNSGTGEDWIDTFFNGGAEAIVHFYADKFVFEDVTLFQTINNKEDLYRAFLPFNNAGPESPAGVHQFDVIRYDGGLAGDLRGVARTSLPENYTAQLWAQWSGDTLLGVDYAYDEWAVMQWVWKATHNLDFLGLPAKGKTTYCRGMTFHAYCERKIVREFTHWNFRGVAVQLGALAPQDKFWLKDFQPAK